MRAGHIAEEIPSPSTLCFPHVWTILSPILDLDHTLNRPSHRQPRPRPPSCHVETGNTRLLWVADNPQFRIYAHVADRHASLLQLDSSLSPPAAISLTTRTPTRQTLPFIYYLSTPRPAPLAHFTRPRRRLDHSTTNSTIICKLDHSICG